MFMDPAAAGWMVASSLIFWLGVAAIVTFAIVRLGRQPSVARLARRPLSEMRGPKVAITSSRPLAVARARMTRVDGPFDPRPAGAADLA
jgi:hypothetical protein